MEGFLLVRHCANTLIYIISVTGIVLIIDEEREAQRDYVTRPKSHSYIQTQVRLTWRSLYFSHLHLNSSSLMRSAPFQEKNQNKNFQFSDFSCLNFNAILLPFTPVHIQAVIICPDHYSSTVSPFLFSFHCRPALVLSHQVGIPNLLPGVTFLLDCSLQGIAQWWAGQTLEQLLTVNTGSTCY